MRFVSVTDLFTLARPEAHPHGMDEAAFAELYTEDKPVMFNFHGYASAVHQLIHRRPAQERFSVRGYAEEGTTTTPFELLAMNGVDRYQLAIDALAAGRRRGRRRRCAACRGRLPTRTLAKAQEAITKLMKQARGASRVRGAKRETTRPRSSSGRGRGGGPGAADSRLARSVYVTAMEPQSGKSIVALGAHGDALGARGAGRLLPADRAVGAPSSIPRSS